MKMTWLGLLLLPGMVLGYEIKDNPDRFPSLGIIYSGHNLKGDLNYGTIVWTPQPEAKDKLNSFMGDARVPINDMLTIEAGIGYAKHTIEGIDGSVVGNNLFYDTTKADMSGPTYKLGARIYFH
jgi:hypothetical protein